MGERESVALPDKRRCITADVPGRRMAKGVNAGVEAGVEAGVDAGVEAGADAGESASCAAGNGDLTLGAWRDLLRTGFGS